MSRNTEANNIPTGTHTDSEMEERGEPVSSIRMKRRLNVTINGSLQTFALKGPSAGIWKPVDGKHVDVFGLHSHDGISMDHGAVTNALRNVTIHKVTFLEQKSTFPVNIGVQMSCVTPEEATDTGDKYVTTAMPNSCNTTPLVVFQTDVASAEGLEWRKKYPSYNASNLETWGVMEVQRKPYLFVHADHPVISLIRVNSDLLGQDINEQPMLDGQWYKVGRQIFSTCCNTLRNRVLSRVATRDMNQFSVQIHRLGEQDWTDVGDGTELLADFTPNPTWTTEQSKAAESKYMEVMLKKPCTYTARVEIEYEINAI